LLRGLMTMRGEGSADILQLRRRRHGRRGRRDGARRIIYFAALGTRQGVGTGFAVYRRLRTPKAPMISGGHRVANIAAAGRSSVRETYSSAITHRLSSPQFFPLSSPFGDRPGDACRSRCALST